MRIVFEDDAPVIHPVLGRVTPGPNDVDPEKKAAAVAIAGSEASFRLMTGDEPFGGTITRTRDGATWDAQKGCWVPAPAKPARAKAEPSADRPAPPAAQKKGKGKAEAK